MTNDTLVFKRGRGITLVFGLAALTFGILIVSLLNPVLNSEIATFASKLVTSSIICVASLICIVTGLLLSNGPDMVTLDKRLGSVIYQYGQVVALKRNTIPLGEVIGVTIHEKRWGGSPTMRNKRYYSVELEFKNNRKSLSVDISSLIYADALLIAEQITSFLGVPLVGN